MKDARCSADDITESESPQQQEWAQKVLVDMKAQQDEMMLACFQAIECYYHRQAVIAFVTALSIPPLLPFKPDNQSPPPK